MARPLKEKLDYFPHSAIQESEEMEAFLNSNHWNYYVYFRLRELICRKGGYYIAISDIETDMFKSESDLRKDDTESIKQKFVSVATKEAFINKSVLFNKLDISEEQFNKVLEEAFLYNAFDREIYYVCGVLTSKLIQEDFLKATEKRKQITLISNFILFDIDFITLNYGVIKHPSIRITKDSNYEGYKIAEIQTKDINALSSNKANRFVERMNLISLNKDEFSNSYSFNNASIVVSEKKELIDFNEESDYLKVYSAIELAMYYINEFDKW